MECGAEILFTLVLGDLLFGSKQLHTRPGHVERSKAKFEKTSRSFKSQLEAELDATCRSVLTRGSAEVSRKP